MLLLEAEPDRLRLFCRWCGWVVAAGVVVRLLGLWMDPLLWGDEAYLAHSVVRGDGGWGVFLEPLANRQVAAPGFGWMSQVVWRWRGELGSLRWPGFAGGMVAMVVTGWLAWMLARGSGAGVDGRGGQQGVGAGRAGAGGAAGPAFWLGAAVAGGSWWLLRYSVELKGYTWDAAFAGVGWGLLCVQVRHRGRHQGRYWGRFVVGLLPGLLGVVGVWMSLTLAIVLAGAGAGLGLGMLMGRGAWGWRHWAGLVIGGLLAMVSGLVLWWAVMEPYRSSETAGFMDWYWRGAGGFPERAEAWTAWWWLVSNLTGAPFGHPLGVGAWSAVVWVGLWLWGGGGRGRGGEGTLAMVLGGPVVLAAVLGLVGVYPFGGHARVTLYLAPGVLAGVALGLLELHNRLGVRGRAWLWVVVMGLLLGNIGVFGGLQVWRGWSERRAYPLREMLAEVRREAEAGALVVFWEEPDSSRGRGPEVQFSLYAEQALGTDWIRSDRFDVPGVRQGQVVWVLAHDPGAGHWREGEKAGQIDAWLERLGVDLLEEGRYRFFPSGEHRVQMVRFRGR